MSVSTHVLDAARGRPARGVPVRWESRAPGSGNWEFTAASVTDADGRVGAGNWLTPGGPELDPGAGDHRLIFDTGAWFAAQGLAAFYPEVIVTFTVADAGVHVHVPLLLSPFSYTTYRGS